MPAMTLRELENTKWVGRAELWLDSLQNETITCDCSITVRPDAVEYTWSYEGKPHTGRVSLREGGADFVDSWHSPTAMPAKSNAGSWALVDVFGTYAAGDGPPWGWRIYLSHRPTDELVLQMTNVNPWGEDGRAVRMICKRA
jgi:hypothetical protein